MQFSRMTYTCTQWVFNWLMWGQETSCTKATYSNFLCNHKQSCLMHLPIVIPSPATRNMIRHIELNKNNILTLTLTFCDTLGWVIYHILKHVTKISMGKVKSLSCILRFLCICSTEAVARWTDVEIDSYFWVMKFLSTGVCADIDIYTDRN